MTTARPTRRWLVAAGLAALLLAATARAEGGVTYSLIASPDVKLGDLTLGEARRLMLGERRFWSDGLPVTTLVPGSGNPARRFLLERLFRMSESAYRRHTLGQLYRGELDYAPKVVASDDEAIAFVAAGRGVAALVASFGVLPDSVRVLRVDGRRPGETGYPLVSAP